MWVCYCFALAKSGLARGSFWVCSLALAGSLRSAAGLLKCCLSACLCRLLSGVWRRAPRSLLSCCPARGWPKEAKVIAARARPEAAAARRSEPSARLLKPQQSQTQSQPPRAAGPTVEGGGGQRVAAVGAVKFAFCARRRRQRCSHTHTRRSLLCFSFLSALLAARCLQLTCCLTRHCVCYTLNERTRTHTHTQQPTAAAVGAEATLEATAAATAATARAIATATSTATRHDTKQSKAKQREQADFARSLSFSLRSPSSRLLR